MKSTLTILASMILFLALVITPWFVTVLGCLVVLWVAAKLNRKWARTRHPVYGVEL